MEGSGETQCSKTSPCDKNADEDNQSEGNNESCDNTQKDGGLSSSNSTIEEHICEKISKPSVRPYVRSKMPRLRWTPDLHLRFLQAVERLGGPERATPKLVLQTMGIKGLNIAHVKSHLQMYRSKKIDDPNQGIPDHRFFMEGAVDRNIFNLSQLPLLPTFNQRHHSNFRYGDASCNGKWSTPVRQNKQGFYGGRMLASYYYSSSKYPRISSFNDGIMKDELLVQSKQNPIDQLNSSKLLQPRIDHDQQRITSSDFAKSINYPPKENINVGLKRKANCELDLNLSLGIESKNGDDEKSNFTLSLNTSPMLSSLRMKLSEDNNERGASTLDLTL